MTALTFMIFLSCMLHFIFQYWTVLQTRQPTISGNKIAFQLRFRLNILGSHQVFHHRRFPSSILLQDRRNRWTDQSCQQPDERPRFQLQGNAFSALVSLHWEFFFSTNFTELSTVLDYII